MKYILLNQMVQIFLGFTWHHLDLCAQDKFNQKLYFFFLQVKIHMLTLLLGFQVFLEGFTGYRYSHQSLEQVGICLPCLSGHIRVRAPVLWTTGEGTFWRMRQKGVGFPQFYWGFNSKLVTLRKGSKSWFKHCQDGFPGGSMLKNPPSVQETRVWSLAWKDPACHGATKPWATAIEAPMP